MSKNLIVPIGGTAARVAEAFIHLAAAGIVDGDSYEMCFVDMDLDCQDYQHCRDTLTNYAVAKEMLSDGKFFMKAQLSGPIIQNKVSSWKLDDEVKTLLENNGKVYKEDTNLEAIAKTSEDQTLMKFFHSTDELTKRKLKQGFYGHPVAGATLISVLFETNGIKNNPIFQVIDNSTSEPINVVLIASTFGATGASIFPNLARKIREYYSQLASEQTGRKKLTISGVVMLPYCSYPPTVNRAVIDPNTFLEKTKTILEYYDRQSDLLQPGNDGNYVFDDLYFIGADQLKLNSIKYCEGGSAQEHVFLAPDVIGGLAIRDAFRSKEGAASHMYVYNHIGNILTLPDGANGKLGTLTEFWLGMRYYLYSQLKNITDTQGENRRLLGTYYNAAEKCAGMRNGLLAYFSKKYTEREMKNSKPTDTDSILKVVSAMANGIDKAVPYFKRYLQFMFELHSELQPDGTVNNSQFVTILDSNLKEEYGHAEELMESPGANSGQLLKKTLSVYGNSSLSVTNYQSGTKNYKGWYQLEGGDAATAFTALQAYAATAYRAANHQ